MAMLLITIRRGRGWESDEDGKDLCFQVYATSQSMPTVCHVKTKPVDNVRGNKERAG